MNGINKVTIEAVSIKEPRSVTVNNKPKQVWDVGIQVNGDWINGTIWNESEIEPFKECKGTEIELNFYDDQGSGKYEGRVFHKFKFLTPKEVSDRLIKRIEALEERVTKAEDFIEHFTIKLAKEDTPVTGEMSEDEMNEKRIKEQEQIDDLPF